MQRIIIAISFLLFSLGLNAQVRFDASIDANKIFQGSTVNVEYTLYNGDGKSFSPPDFKGLKVVGGPNQSTSMSFVNGKTTQQKSYSYSLLATAPGKYTIQPATIVVGTQKMRSKSLKIEVVKATAQSKANAEDDVYISAELSDSIVMVGQQVILNYKMYHRVSVENYNLLNEPEYDGFYVEELSGRRARAQREIIDGKEYYVQSLKKVSLFPQQTGIYEYDAVIGTLGLSKGNSNQRRGFFSRRNVRNVNRKTRPIKIQVVSSPTNAPRSYSGGVGTYAMNARLDKKSITTDDAIKITMVVQGSGDPKILQAPDQNFGKDLEVYEPNILREEQLENQGFIKSTKEFEYLIVPKKTGRFNIRPEFSYYNPDSNRYETLTAGPFVVNVAKGTKALNTLETLKSDKELSAIIPNAKYRSKSTSLFGSRLHWGLLGLILLAIPALFIYKLKLRKEANIDPRLVQMQNAEKVAIAKLSVAKSHMDQSAVRPFYEEIQNGIFGYLADRLEMPYSQMNRSDIGNILSNKDVPTELTDRVESILKKAEMALFAGAGSEGMPQSYNDAKELILGLESHFS